MSGLLVLGAGGHGKVVADILQCMGLPVLGFLDDDPARWGTVRLGLPVLGPITAYVDQHADGLVPGIGDNAGRRRMVEGLGPEAVDLWRNAIHPTATVAASARLGRGVVIAAHTVINPDTILGDHVIINTGATVDHDCRIECHAHIAPGVHLSGGVVVGAGALLGVGVIGAPGVHVGDWAVVGAGAVVVHDIPAHVTAKGVPARW